MYQLLDYYSNELSIKNLIWKYIDKTKMMFNGIAMLLFFPPIFWIARLVSWWMLVLAIIPILLLLLIINSQYKKALFDSYNIVLTGFLWNVDAYYKMTTSMMESYLRDNGINTLKKLAYVISFIAEQTDKAKTPYLINRGIFAALFVPIWIELIKWIYSHVVNSILDAFLVFWCTFIVVMAISWLYIMIENILDDICNAHYNRLKSLAYSLNDIHFKWMLQTNESFESNS